MMLRAEAPADILSIDALLKVAFETSAEADLVMGLRENGKNTLSLVACDDDGQLIGHLMFSPVTIDQQDVGVQGLGTLCVHPEHRSQGIGECLVKEGLEFLAELGYAGCVVRGSNEYYQRFGFELAQNLVLSYPKTHHADRLMAISFHTMKLSSMHASLAYAEGFSTLQR